MKNFQISAFSSPWLGAAIALALVLQFNAFAQMPVFNIKDFGAVANKTDLATKAIQTAIDRCFEAGGGTVYVPPGDYLSGTIVLKDNTTLYLEAGATLYASRDTSDLFDKPRYFNGTSVFIYAEDAKNISIRGKGTLHGQAERVYEDLRKVDKFIADITENARRSGVEMKQYYWVPPPTFLVLFSDCIGVTVEDVSMLESTYWTFHLNRCERVSVRGIYIYSDLESGVNADGIDITSCKDVTISDCVIITGDDGICLKTKHGDGKPCENVTVTNCIVSSSSTALKLGTESYGDFRNIVFNNCVVRDSNRGLSIVVRDGARVSDVIFSNITIECTRRHFNWWGSADPIWMIITKRRPKSKIGFVENVLFENIIARGQGTSRIESTGGKQYRNIQLKNVQLHMDPESKPDKRADHAFYADNVDGLILDGINVSWNNAETEKKWASAVYVTQSNDVVVNDVQGRQGLLESNFPVIELNDVNDAILTNARADNGAKTLLKVSGEKSSNIVLRNNDLLQKAEKHLEVNKEVPTNQVKDLDGKQ